LLRRRLDEVTRAPDDAEQIRLVATLAGEHPHSIQLSAEAVLADRKTWAFNCHTYTFGLRGSEEVLRLVTRTIFPNGAYVTSLIDGMLTETEDAEEGDFVVYFQDASVTHSGLWSHGRLRSKWGTGHVWEHALHEVPLRYGDEVRFFGAQPAERCIAAFVAFARAAGRSG